jgi:hypothetical protein
MDGLEFGPTEELPRNPPLHTAVPSGTVCPVSSHNEWDPLEEIIVGRVEGATVASDHVAVTATIPDKAAQTLFKLFSGWKYPGFMVDRARQELEGLVRLLKGLGVIVRRPEATDYSVRFKTPEWRSRGFANACPRDSLPVVGDRIIEAPMAWRCRYFETFSYRPLLKDYFRQGARRMAAPKPRLPDELYDAAYRPPENGAPITYVTNEFEPVFDAADFMRCGTDLFATRSNVTNRGGTWANPTGSTRSRAAVHGPCTSIPACCPWRRASCSSIRNISTWTGSPRCSSPGISWSRPKWPGGCSVSFPCPAAGCRDCSGSSWWASG